MTGSYQRRSRSSSSSSHDTLSQNDCQKKTTATIARSCVEKIDYGDGWSRELGTCHLSTRIFFSRVFFLFLFNYFDIHRQTNRYTSTIAYDKLYQILQFTGYLNAFGSGSVDKSRGVMRVL